MHAFSVDIYNYLGGVCLYRIPLYQRTYSWEREQCARLWDDIVNIHRDHREGHFIGSIVRISEEAPAGKRVAMIIDGQQRLTTLTLLLVALRDYALEHPECDVNPDQITQTHLINIFEQADGRYKLLLTQSDRDALIRKINRKQLMNNLQSRIFDNYNFFAQQIANGVILPTDLYNAIGMLQIVDVVLDRRHDDPQAIFESLNSTGMDLNDSDLIRNFLLMGLDTETQAYVYDEFWRPTELLFDYEQQSKLLDVFFRVYLTMKLGRIPKEKEQEIYKEFRGFHRNSGMPVIDRCIDIYRHARLFTDMYFARSEDGMLTSLYRDMKEISMGVAYPFLLKVLEDYTNGMIQREELLEIIQLCVSYVLRRAICGMPTNSLHRIFASIKNNIRPDDYLNSVKAFFILLDSNRVFPDDQRFLEDFKTRDIYNMNRCRYILRKLENWDNNAVVVLDNLTIEHIIPQNPALSPEWIAALGENWSEVQRTYLHTIGNLTLTAYNAEMSDSSFTDKLNMPGGFIESALRLNRYVIRQNIWGEQQVVERASILSEVARMVWPYPSLTDEEIAPFLPQGELAPQGRLEAYPNWNDFNRNLFDMLNTRILNLSTSVKRVFRTQHISYMLETDFVDVVIENEPLLLRVKMKFQEIVDPDGRFRDIVAISNRNNGGVEVVLHNENRLDDVMAIIEQAFRLQEEE